jgi:hypothetical protein
MANVPATTEKFRKKRHETLMDQAFAFLAGFSRCSQTTQQAEAA